MNTLFSLILSVFTLVPIASEETDLGTALYAIKDDSSELTPEQAVEKLQRVGALPHNGHAPNLGLTSQTGYFLVALKNTTTHNRFVLDVGYPILDYVTLYTIRKIPDGYEVSESGDRLPFEQRYLRSRTINFSVKAEPGEELALLLKVKTSGSMQLPLYLYTEKTYSETKTSEYIGLGIYYGFIMVMILFNGFLYIAMREKSYISYIAYLFFYLLFQMTVNGVTFQYVLPDLPNVANELLAISFFLAWAFAIQFASDFLELKIKQRLIGRIYSACLLMSVAFAAVSPFISYFHMVKIVTLWGSCMPLLFFVAGFKSIIAKFGPARYFVAAWGLFCLGMITFGLKTAGLLPLNFFTEYAMQIGSAAEVILLSLALADRYRVIMGMAEDAQRQRAKAQEKLLSEMETRVIVVSDLAHRMNNPLNYISTGSSALLAEINQYHKTLSDVLPEDSADEDLDVHTFKLSINQRKRSIDALLESISIGVRRTAESVASIRSLSGIDGISLKFHTCRQLIEAAMIRTREGMGLDIEAHVRVDTGVEKVGEVFVNYYSVIIVLERLFTLLLKTGSQQVTLTFFEEMRDLPTPKEVLLIKIVAVAETYVAVDGSIIRPLATLLAPFDGYVTTLQANEGLGFLVTLPKTCKTSKDREAEAC